MALMYYNRHHNYPKRTHFLNVRICEAINLDFIVFWFRKNHLGNVSNILCLFVAQQTGRCIAIIFTIEHDEYSWTINVLCVSRAYDCDTFSTWSRSPTKLSNEHDDFFVYDIELCNVVFSCIDAQPFC
jgi:hypothetical protein